MNEPKVELVDTGYDIWEDGDGEGEYQSYVPRGQSVSGWARYVGPWMVPKKAEGEEKEKAK